MSILAATSPSTTYGFSISENGILTYDGRPILTDVPANVTLSQYSSIYKGEESPSLSASSISDGAFLGFKADEGKSRHVFSIGKLKGTKFASIFRFKQWWTTHWTGKSGSDIETETQILILDTHSKAESEGVNDFPYIVFLPIYEGKFRASLQAGSDDNVDVCVESGSSMITESSFISSVYVHACHDPILLVKDAVAAVKPHLGSFKMLEEKPLPSIVGSFGWCTWDAFYLTVNPEGVWSGVKALNDCGVPPRFIIIDDGWQSITFDDQSTSEDATSQTVAGDQMWCRLNRVCENRKFSSYKKGTLSKKQQNGQAVPPNGIVRDEITLQAKPVHEENGVVNGCIKEEDVIEVKLSSDKGLKFSLSSSAHPKNGFLNLYLKEKDLVDVKLCNGFTVEGLDLNLRSSDHKKNGVVNGYLKEDGCINGAIQPMENGDVKLCKVTIRPRLNGTLKLCNGAIHPREDEDGKLSCLSMNENGDAKVSNDMIRIEGDLKQKDVGLKAFINDLKSLYPHLQDIYVWHALIGYWGGVRPDGIDNFGAEILKPVLAPGLLTTMKDLAVDKLVNNSMGLVPPQNAFAFYDKMHSYLAESGVTGLKVDVIHVLEMLGEKHGGRMELCKKYYEALSKSIRKNFGGNRVIASMQHCNDFMLTGTEQITLGRVGDDFWPEDANGNPLLWLQGIHMVHCAYNSLWMGQFFRPDWDMFQTSHPTAPFHAASRVISGGPIYVSDKPGKHNFELLKRMVHPDGTLPVCVGFALPTRDCIFEDPLHDGKTLLKIWNFNKSGGVLGVFNCQGGGWCRENRSTMPSLEHFVTCTTKVSPLDICWSHMSSFFDVSNQDTFVIYSMQHDKIFILNKNDSIELTLKPLDHDILTTFPLLEVSNDVKFSPIGLLNMINSGGTVESIDLGEGYAKVKVQGQGMFCAYASCEPKACMLDGKVINFTYDPRDGRALVQVPWKVPHIELEFVFFHEYNSSFEKT